MKLKLLSASIFFGATTVIFGQSLQFTQANEPVAGDGRGMLVVEVADAAAFDVLTQAHVNGNIWDYRGISVTTETSVMGVETTANHPTHSTDYSSATKYFKSGPVDNFISSSASVRSSHGYVYSDLIGTDPVVIHFSNSGQTLMTYPFAEGNSTSGPISGTMTATYSGLPLNINFAGVGNVRYTHANGDILLPNSEVISGVSRVIYMDSIAGQTMLGTATLKRTVVEYYVEAQGNLPVMVETSARLFLGNSTTPVMSAQTIEIDEDYQNYVSTSVVDLFQMTIAPNPSNGTITINGDFNSASVKVVDIQGKVVATESLTAGSSFNITQGAGVYFVSVSTEKGTQTQKVVIK